MGNSHREKVNFDHPYQMIKINCMKKRLPLVGIILMVALMSTAQTERVGLVQGWKFQKGDDPAWAKAGFTDAGWAPVGVMKSWEEAGYREYDGYAWYRISFSLPSSLKTSSFFRDSLVVCLGRIDDNDETFLNGKLIGRNGITLSGRGESPQDLTTEPWFWDVDRKYRVAVTDDCVRWDADNILAVRIYDQGGPGGMYEGTPTVRLLCLEDYLMIDKNTHPFLFTDPDKVTKTLRLENRNAAIPIRGKLIVQVKNDLTGDMVFNSERDIALNPRETSAQQLEFDRADESCSITCTFLAADMGASLVAVDELPYLLTPAPPDEPRINGPVVHGARPGHPFLFTISVTGKRPMQFDAKGLPEGLILDPATGIISGVIREKGEYVIRLGASNDLGSTGRELKIVAGDRLCLTPPLGWNSWNCWGLSVDDEKIRRAAESMISSGLADHGWTYINIDDGWEKERGADGIIVTNEKFKDMKALADYVHSRGFRLGIYSSPGELTCGGYTGSLGFEEEDARTWAAWGIDYVKYDWCSYGRVAKDKSLPELKKPYLKMREALDRQERDIVYSLCQYGMGNVWEWGESVGGNLWRTTGDITDTWESLSSIGFSQGQCSPYAGPGHWNDPDMLVVGMVGWGPHLHPTGLTVNEQYTHISLWALLAAPMLIGCDLDRLDDFTLNLLTNDEVLAVNQDPLGSQASPMVKGAGFHMKNTPGEETPPAMTGPLYQVWMKDLSDGSKAIGIFNVSGETQSIILDLHALGFEGKTGLRDLWRQKDLGVYDQEYRARVPAHGVVLLKALRVDR